MVTQNRESKIAQNYVREQREWKRIGPPMTVQLAWELRDTAIKVNTVNPGYTATDVNVNRGTQTLKEGAAEAFRQALAPDDALTGALFETGASFPGESSLKRRCWQRSFVGA
jgi:NAD(P)-dependent dehydrogenase (short-subunit alcohol dehydrogenase family)